LGLWFYAVVVRESNAMEHAMKQASSAPMGNNLATCADRANVPMTGFAGCARLAQALRGSSVCGTTRSTSSAVQCSLKARVSSATDSLPRADAGVTGS
jgi:hypothetical protein